MSDLLLRVDDDRYMKEVWQEIADHDDVGADDADVGDDDAAAVDGGGMSATKKKTNIKDSGDGGGSSDSASSIKHSSSSSGSSSGLVRHNLIQSIEIMWLDSRNEVKFMRTCTRQHVSKMIHLTTLDD